MNDADDGGFFQLHDDRFAERRGCRYPLRLSGKAALAEEFVAFEDRDDGLLALLGNDGDFHLALLDVEDLVRRVTLREYDLVLAVGPDAAAFADLGKKSFRIERCLTLDRHGGPSAMLR